MSQRKRKPCSAAARKKMSLAKRGLRNPNSKGGYVIDGVRYESLKQAAMKLKVSVSTIRYRMNNIYNRVNDTDND